MTKRAFEGPTACRTKIKFQAISRPRSLLRASSAPKRALKNNTMNQTKILSPKSTFIRADDK